jgi:hypothetical protein
MLVSGAPRKADVGFADEMAQGFKSSGASTHDVYVFATKVS